MDALSMGPLDGINYILAAIFNGGLKIMSFLLAISGAVLNFSITLTLNIKEFVDKAPAIYTTWRAIRDISGILFIFYLLYSAIQLILGLKGPKYADTLKNIVIAGVLINFSFFFAGLGIDASNIVSKQLYNAIAPNNGLASGTTNIGAPITVDSILGAGGISNIFMNSLEIQTIYSTTNSLNENTNVTNDNDGGKVVSAVKDPFKIILMGVVGILIEFVAAMSFFAAALAFIGRFVMLLFLLAFSPIYCLSFLSPEVKEYAGKWTSMYKSMLLFMPVYLLLMYLALSVLTTTPMFNKGQSGAPVAATTGVSGPSGQGSGSIIENALAESAPSASSKSWYADYLLLAVNATIVIFLLNMPLVVAASIAGKGSKTIGGLLDGAVKKFGAGTVWRGFGSQAGSRTLGRAAYFAGQSKPVAWLASKTPLGGQLVSTGLSKVSQSGFGGEKKKSSYEDRLAAKKKAQEELHKKIGTVDRTDFKAGAEGELEFIEAQKKRREYQSTYRGNLPWKGVVGGAIGFMVDNRANKQSSQILTDEANLKGNQVAQANIVEKMDEIIDKQLKASKEELAREEALSSAVIRTKDEIKVIEDLKAQIKDLNEAKKGNYAGYKEKYKGKPSVFNSVDVADLDSFEQQKSILDSQINRATKKKQREDVATLAKVVADQTEAAGSATPPSPTPPATPPAGTP